MPFPTRNTRQLVRVRRFCGALVVGLLAAACSSVPDVTYLDGEPAATLDASLADGAVAIVAPDASGSSSSGDASASGGAGSSGAPPATCQAVVASTPLQCCGSMQCVGDGCGTCGVECGSKCKDPKRYCCKNRGKSLCLKADEDCAEETED